jgi:hypothetical protein
MFMAYLNIAHQVPLTLFVIYFLLYGCYNYKVSGERYKIFQSTLLTSVHPKFSVLILSKLKTWIKTLLETFAIAHIVKTLWDP